MLCGAVLVVVILAMPVVVHKFELQIPQSICLSEVV
uniref:Uncharacterized protein n=1 Tax=Anguilla anguilla TaxID=7936 RepID=A0A0E9P5F4_ANGAN